jgi:hypothetical protein
MRFSIVVDEDETILTASERDEEIDKPRRGAGVSMGSFEVPADLPEVTQSPAGGEADDPKYA